jgi:hypothetical protein
MSELAYIVKVRTAEGKRDEALAALGPLVDAVEARRAPSSTSCTRTGPTRT